MEFTKIAFKGLPGRLVLGNAPGFPTFKRKYINQDLYDVQKLKPAEIVVLMSNWDMYLNYANPKAILQVYDKMGFHVTHFSINDLDTPNDMEYFDQLLNFISKKLREGDVLMHCSAGLGRTGLVAAALLIKGNVPVQDAIKYIRSRRPGAIETKPQEEFLSRYKKYLEGVK